jgi:hypothetical protein
MPTKLKRGLAIGGAAVVFGAAIFCPVVRKATGTAVAEFSEMAAYIWSYLIRNSLVSPIAIVFSASSAGAFAWHNIRTAREINRNQTTLRLILDAEEKDQYRTAQRVFFKEFPETLTAPDRAKAIYDSRSTDTDHTLYDISQHVDFFLNHYELIAVAIGRKILDEGFYGDWMRSSYTKAWNQALPYIRVTRADGDTTSFAQFQSLARKWGGQAL